jgi:hypothetical protein
MGKTYKDMKKSKDFFPKKSKKPKKYQDDPSSFSREERLHKRSAY